MNERQIREKLETIDRLRADADTCRRMATGWLGMDFELVAVTPVVVKRRFRHSKVVSQEITMDAAERGIFRDWLAERAGRMDLEADKLAGSLAGGENEVSA
ncbi:hypothetical protein [Salinicola acroporae]|uniref:Uncharacterized protein n=1 Tax=Salinicola acroporae TaxID=1541440 RepID=A0ABT6I453_9GAMM|nr:hypothetical protein [Salinicola acroporae]MDH4572448.1 hypothetical protein [Salinicola acroporae]